MNRRLYSFGAAFAGATIALTACDGFKEAMSAHQDVVARVGSQELTVQRLAELLGNSQIPLNQEVAKAVADLWVDYQLLAVAASRNDSLKDPQLVEEAIWPLKAQARAEKWHEQVSKSFRADTGGGEAKYNQGEMLAAQHILIMAPEQGLSQAKRDSIKRVAEALRARVNSANFAALAREHSNDPGSKANGGYYHAFPKGMMVGEFENALVSLKPGDIAPGLVTTQYGYHIIRRPNYAEVKAQYDSALAERGTETADSVFMAGVEAGGNIKFASNAVSTIREVAKDVQSHRRSNTVIATSRAGDFTARRMTQWLDAYPEQQREQLKQGLATRPDSEVTMFVRRRFVVGELVLRQADSLKIQLDTADSARFVQQFRSLVTMSWNQLGIAPTSLDDSAKTPGERQRVAAAQIDTYLDRLLANQAPYVPVPGQLEAALREKFDWRVNPAGLSRALERGMRVRAAADSVRASQQPQTQVPMPQGPRPQVQPPQGSPQGAPPPTKQP